MPRGVQAGGFPLRHGDLDGAALRCNRCVELEAAPDPLKIEGLVPRRKQGDDDADGPDSRP